MVTQDKTYIYRKYFGFDVKSIIFQFENILKVEYADLYFYGVEYYRLGENIKSWIDFYCKWICNLDSIEDSFLEFIEDSKENLKPIFLTSSDVLQEHLSRALLVNPKEQVYEQFALGVVRNAFACED